MQLLLLFVVILTIYVDISISELYYVIDMRFKLFKKHIKFSEIFHVGFVIICYADVFVFSIIITMFLKFHIHKWTQEIIMIKKGQD